jgi:hypothetical protein
MLCQHDADVELSRWRLGGCAGLSGHLCALSNHLWVGRKVHKGAGRGRCQSVAWSCCAAQQQKPKLQMTSAQLRSFSYQGLITAQPASTLGPSPMPWLWPQHPRDSPHHPQLHQCVPSFGEHWCCKQCWGRSDAQIYCWWHTSCALLVMTQRQNWSVVRCSAGLGV